MITVAIAKQASYCVNIGGATAPENFKEFLNKFPYFILVHISIYSYANILYNKLNSYLEEDD